MKKRLYEIVVVMLAALMLTAIGCGDDDKTPVDGDTDDVEVDGDVTEDEIDGDVTEDEVDGDETEDVEADGDDTDDTDDVEVDGDVTDDEPVANVCEPNPCGGSEADPYRTLCVEDDGETAGYRCDCADGYEDVTYTDPNSGSDVTICWAEEAMCTADVTVTFDDNGMYTNTDDTTDAGNDFIVFIDPEYRCAQPAAWTMDGLDHVYAVELAVGDVLEIDVTVDSATTPDFDPALIISDSCSNRVQCLGAADSGGDAEAETLTFEAETAGTYFVSVDSGYAAEGEYASHAYGAYTLNMMKYSIEACTANEAVAMDSLPWTGDYELNVADDQDITASCMGETVTGSDKVFSVALTADQEIIVTVEPIATPTKADTDFDPFVYMMDATCYNIGPDATCLAGANRYGAGMTESLVFKAPADGTYYIVVDTLQASVTDSHFTITVDTFTATACEGTEITDLPFTTTDATTAGGMDNIALSCGDGYGIGADDIYWMAMTADQMIEIDLTSDEALVVMVADADGCILNNPGACLAGDEEHILFTAPADGNYFFVVDSLDGSEGAYTLDVKTYVPVPCTGTEITTLPFEVTDGTTVGGSNDIELTCGGDAATGNDVIYSIAMEADDVIDITLGGVADDVNLMVMVADAEGCILNNPGTCLTSAADMIRFAPTEAATYFIIVDSLDGTEGAYTLNVEEFVPQVCVGDYDVAVANLPYTKDDGDTTDKGNDFEEYDCASLTYEGNDELYAVEFEAGKMYRITANAADLDLGIFVLDSCYSNAAEMNHCIAKVDSTLSGEESLLLEITDAGTYFVVVDVYDVDTNGAYTLSIEEFIPEAFTADVTADLSSLPYTNTYDTTTINESRLGSYNCYDYAFDGGEVVYALTVEAGDSFTITATPATDSGLDMGIFLMDVLYSNAPEMNNCLAVADIVLNEDSAEGKTGEEQLIWKFEEAGDFFLVIDTFDEDLYGSYTLTIDSVVADKGSAEECVISEQCDTTSTDGICHTVQDAYEVEYSFCAITCTTDDDCGDYVDGCCLIEDGASEGFCSVAAGCGEAGMTAATADACAYSGIDINLPLCSEENDICLGIRDMELSWCAMPCGSDTDCSTLYPNGCCVDVSGGWGYTFCLPEAVCSTL